MVPGSRKTGLRDRGRSERAAVALDRPNALATEARREAPGSGVRDISLVKEVPRRAELPERPVRQVSEKAGRSGFNLPAVS